MAGATRRKFTAEFKAEVAVAALRGDKPLANVKPKGGHLDGANGDHVGEKEAAHVFEGPERRAGPPVDVDALYRKIGQIEMERDFLASRPGIVGAPG